MEGRHVSLKPDLTLEHVLAAAIARRVTDGTVAAPTCRAMAYESALEGFRLGISTSAQLLAELAAAADSESGESLRNAERQVRALPGDLPKPFTSHCRAARTSRQGGRPSQKRPQGHRRCRDGGVQ